jgi:hypothetical protein
LVAAVPAAQPVFAVSFPTSAAGSGLIAAR